MSLNVRRPEHSGPPELFYNEEEAHKYTSNSHIISVQSELAERALELLALPDDTPCYLLDIGCGSGLSGEAISDHGHIWAGVDISRPMLDVAYERECDGDLLQGDIGSGLPFKPGSFDGAISISVIQWLCNADTAEQNPRKRLYRFFASLYACLGRGSRAVFQFYPESSQQAELISQQATKAGFSGGLVVDFPNSTKAKKVYLVLFTGGQQKLPAALGLESSAGVRNTERRNTAVSKGSTLRKGSKAWIELKKDRMRKQGRDVKSSSKYTGRKRSGKY